MKKLLGAAIVIIALSILGTGIWTQPIESTSMSAHAPKETPKPQAVAADTHDNSDEIRCMEPMSERTAIEEVSVPIAEPQSDTPVLREAEVTIASTPKNTATATNDPYHTDVYPENVYSEKYEYDAEGNLIGKTTTYPTVFGPDTIWIDGKAYGDVPGFGLVEWGGPGSVTEDYTMYENGNKVGIMGGEDDASAHTASPTQQADCPEPTGEVIDQTITEAPERSSTPPDYKPDTTPPDDPNARIIP